MIPACELDASLISMGRASVQGVIVSDYDRVNSKERVFEAP